MGQAPSTPDPSRTLEVINAGFSRTGSETLAHALAKLLDGPVAHGAELCLGRTDGMFCPSYEPDLKGGWLTTALSGNLTAKIGTNAA
jgi:hypothetical protein